MKTILLTVLLMLFSSLYILNAQNIFTVENCIFKSEDKLIAEEKLKSFQSKSDLPIEELIPEIGYSFLDIPYVAAALENGNEEKMVVNLRGLDCTTFVENCLALARTVKSGKTDFNSFVAELEKIRYRDGIRDQYLSRIHYFSEWISNNTSKKIVSDSPNRVGKSFDKPIRYMSTHPENYSVLKAHPELISILATQEKNISETGLFYFPKNNTEKLLQNLKHGDIIGLTSSIDGLDINHVGIIVWKNEQFHLMHAGQTAKKVVISDGPITDFIKPESKNTGIMIARPIF